MDFLENKFFLLALTFAFFFRGERITEKNGFYPTESYIGYDCPAYRFPAIYRHQL